MASDFWDVCHMDHLIPTTPNCFLIQYCFWSILTKMCPSDHAFMILLKCMKKNHAILRCAKTRFMHMLVTWHGMVWVTVFYWVLAHDEVQPLQVVNINMWNHRQVYVKHATCTLQAIYRVGGKLSMHKHSLLTWNICIQKNDGIVYQCCD